MASRGKLARRERRQAQLVERKIERRTRAQPRWVVPALAGAFFLSGAAALVHEIVWVRLLGRVFGVTEMALSTVLAAFMGGLALGSHLFGRRHGGLADRRRTYAMLEIGIGVAAILIPVALDLVSPVYALLWRRWHLSFAALGVVRFLIAGGLLLAPTIMMGGTLPVLADYLARLEGRRLAPEWLYTVNLAGAVLGVAAAGFVLMPRLGVWGTIVVGAAVNVGVGLWVLGLPPLTEHRPAPGEVSPTPDAPGTRPLLPAAAFVSGLLSLVTQVAWTRVLALIVGSTTYAFSAVLLVNLLALGAGSAWAARYGVRAARVEPLLAVAHVLGALLLVGAVLAVNRVPYWYVALYDVWGPEVHGGAIARGLVIAFAVLFAPVLCAGAVLPLALIGVRPSRGDGTGPAVGRLYAINTLGAIVGAVLAGFVLVPRLGTQRTLLGVALAMAAVGCAFAFARPRRPWLAQGAAAAAALVVAAAALRPGWNYQDLHAGVAEVSRLSSDARRQLTPPGSTLLYEREGPTASVVVNRLPDGVRALVINARTNASDSPVDMATQVLVAQVPMLLAPRAERVFVIGWGSGVSIGSVTLWPEAEVTAVELEPAVVEASQLFVDLNHDPLRSPRLHLYEDDARHILLASEETYDVVISEPPHPWVAGVANLFTRDFYRLAERRLRPDGVFAQWLQTYQISFETYRTVLATFQSVFPEVVVFHPPGGTDTVLLGSRRRLPLDLQALDRRWSAEAIRADLARIGMQRPEHLLASLYLGPDAVRELIAHAPLNTDDNMYVEFQGPEDMERAALESSTEIFGAMEEQATPVETLLTDPSALLGSRERLLALIDGLRLAERSPARYQRLLADLGRVAP